MDTRQVHTGPTSGGRRDSPIRGHDDDDDDGDGDHADGLRMRL